MANRGSLWTTPNNSCFNHFLISLILFVIFIPKMNVLVHSKALKYFKNGNLWRHPASFQREMRYSPEFFVEN